MNRSKIRLDRVTLEYGEGRKPWWSSPRGDQHATAGVPRRILDDISLEVRAGEFMSFLGHSGCGKSTLLKVIAGFVKPTSGAVLIDEEPIDGPQGDHVLVFQEGALFPWLTILKNVSLALTSVPDSAQRLEQARFHLSRVSLEDVEDFYPHMLSGGMRQRAELARALAAQPDILLLDEPFSGLDHLTRLQMREEMAYLQLMLPSMTILFVTHDIDEALQLSNRVVVLSDLPARVECCHTINVAHPRKLTDPVLDELRSQIYHLLGVNAAL